MLTQCFNACAQKENATRLGGRLIQAGEVVAFPTETVYGLGADGLNPEAVRKIFELKGRPGDNPLILHVARKSDVRRLWTQVPPVAQRLMDALWPGPLTLVYQRSDIVPDEVTAGLDTVAVRMPDHKTALALIRAAERPVAAPSANISGKPSPTLAEHVLEDFDGRIPLVIDGGPCRVGVESTVLSLEGVPTILRPGGVTREMLEVLVGEVRLSPAVLHPLGEGESPSSPGMKYRHYAPSAELVVVNGSAAKAAARIRQEVERAEIEGRKCAILATKQTQSFYRGKRYVIIGDRDCPDTLCANLFAALRALEGTADLIFAEQVGLRDSGLAFMNRLLRAAGFQTIEA
ncbi:MAG: L-threonylcarbamoyladenylate synthase [Bacillota bacterium]